MSGVDGAGKSTLVHLLVDSLAQNGVAAGVVWVRPGMGLRWLHKLARPVKRLLGQDPRPGVRIAAADGGEGLASRRGLVGWIWSLLVTLSFVVQVRRAHHASRGVVVYDRHLLDALVTLDVFYAGLDLRLHRALVRALVPEATLTFYLDLPPAVAADRKPGDTIGPDAVRRQVAAYRTWRSQLAGSLALDATLPSEDLHAAAWHETARIVLPASARREGIFP